MLGCLPFFFYPLSSHPVKYPSKIPSPKSSEKLLATCVFVTFVVLFRRHNSITLPIFSRLGFLPPRFRKWLTFLQLSTRVILGMVDEIKAGGEPSPLPTNLIDSFRATLVEKVRGPPNHYNIACGLFWRVYAEEKSSF